MTATTATVDSILLKLTAADSSESVSLSLAGSIPTEAVSSSDELVASQAFKKSPSSIPPGLRVALR
uniref:Uncharacterized protein n=1 Tax=Hyaloperonospora arabidopsidis (strain Emoy2) TaxID=559515 RepID=M4BIX1_HYAAE